MELRQKKHCLEKGTTVSRTTSIASIVSNSSKSRQTYYFWQRNDSELRREITILQLKITQLENYLKEEERSSTHYNKTVSKEINRNSKISFITGIKTHTNSTQLRRRSDIKELKAKSHANTKLETIAEEINGSSNVSVTRVNPQNITFTPIIKSKKDDDKDCAHIKLHSKKLFFNLGSFI
ncbi:hypothetical protein TBLA_0F01830 [Henningerozyma blattae CBS 6284]|uniref:Uncharacterized protein n=1 Tax=Henningerozyma blattae (strain ATCC 34711 / CBS 6284 / DSM 70876 / NBRC 10599 / NRRL Y-10934 / UCD 77-7) TaxID=1071380 RepID=I2H5S3_HENB6|nr:hypothetical protein TBLA_0F01830 [Tetrapisispora blattae CBS 6284]CCH61725.1 hypothetical protein TBLA_0F01830 [Tetrapisispora blattae CBS 6284]